MVKHLNIKFFAVLLVCLALGLPISPSRAGAAGKRMVEVTMVNSLDEKVLLAMGRWRDGSSFSRGWWSVDPGATRTIRPFEYNDGDHYYFYAVSESGERIWRGSDDYDSTIFWLHSTKAFDCPPGKKVRGGKKARFHSFTQNYWKNQENSEEGFILKFQKDTSELDESD